MPNGWIWLVLLATAVVAIVLYGPFASSNSIEFSDFMRWVEAKEVKKVTFVGMNSISGKVKDPSAEIIQNVKKLRGSKFQTQLPPTDNLLNFANELAAKDPKLQIAWEQETGACFGPILLTLLPILLLLGIIFLFMMRFRDPLGGGFLTNYIKSPAKRYDKTKMRVTFDDVADMENAKSELGESSSS